MMFNKEIYQERRRLLKKQVGSGIVLLLGNEESSINYRDNWYPFRQDSSFLYFTGIDRPGLAVLIDIDQDTEILFGQESTVEDIIWTGPQESLSASAERAGLPAVKPLAAIASALQSFLHGNRDIHFLPPYRPEHLLRLNEWLSIPPALAADSASVSLIKAVVAQRSVKSAEEIAEIEKAVNITAEMQTAAIRLAEEGVTEAAIAGALHGIALSAGGNLSFPTILTVNGQYLHLHYGRTALQKDQMVLCDCGAETALHYAGDLTRTFPVNRSFSSRQKEIYAIVWQAHRAAAEALRPGMPFRDIHLLACETLVAGLKAIGLMQGDVKEAVAAGAHALFFQCGLGHMMGLDVHDMENLGEAHVGYTDTIRKSTAFGLKSLRLGRALEPGFVLTVEPGIYFIPELIAEWKAQKKLDAFICYDKLDSYENFGGIRIEDDFLITASGSRLLGLPPESTAETVEALRAPA